jgi:hypothetical protein
MNENRIAFKSAGAVRRKDQERDAQLREIERKLAQGEVTPDDAAIMRGLVRSGLTA